jgi:phage antirepressor YoqD-like protein
MIADRLDSDDVSLTYITDSLGRQQQTNIINESGLYSVILRSDKPEAKAFKRWVTHEVLPQIRKTGGYNLPRTLPDALRLAADLAEENEKLKPKAEMHDLFLSAANAQPMGDVAKALGVGRNSLFKVLREARVLMYNNTPYQRFIDRGYFEVIEKPIVIGESTINKPLTLVTPKGIDYIGRMLKEGHHEISAYS